MYLRKTSYPFRFEASFCVDFLESLHFFHVLALFFNEINSQSGPCHICLAKFVVSQCDIDGDGEVISKKIPQSRNKAESNPFC